jgi:hypothetical protein
MLCNGNDEGLQELVGLRLVEAKVDDQQVEELLHWHHTLALVRLNSEAHTPPQVSDAELTKRIPKLFKKLWVH